MQRTSFSLMVACLLLASGASLAQSYKWRDADGKLHVSDKPPPGTKTEMIEAKPLASDAGANERAQTSLEQRERAALMEKQAKQKAAANVEKQRAANDRRCQLAQNDLDTLNRQAPVYTVGRDGNRQYMDDSQRAAEIQRRQALVRQYCR